MKELLLVLGIVLAVFVICVGGLYLDWFFHPSYWELSKEAFEHYLLQQGDLIEHAETPSAITLLPFTTEGKSPRTELLIKIDLPPGKKLRFVRGNQAGTYRFKVIDGEMSIPFLLFWTSAEVKRVTVDGQKLPVK